MSKRIITLVGGILVAMYAAVSFVIWEFNPAHWSEVSRFIFVWFGTGASGLAVMLEMTK